MRHFTHLLARGAVVAYLIALYAMSGCWLVRPSNRPEAEVGYSDPLADFEDMTPPRETSDLGSVIGPDGRAALLGCFEGSGGPEERSVDSLAFTYAGGRTGELKAKFNDVFEMTDLVGVTDSVTVALNRLKIVMLKDIYATYCSEMTREGGEYSTESHDVVLQAVSAGSIRVEQYGGRKLEIDFNTKYQGQEVLGLRYDDGYRRSRTYVGTNLYFAHFLRPYSVTRTMITDTLAAGETGLNTTAVEDCIFELGAIAGSRWDGQMSCMVGSHEFVGGRTNVYAEHSFGGGVSVMVVVQAVNEGPLGRVQLFKFTIRES